MAATATFVPVEEYLSTTYRPDCDYVDGVLEERHVGQKDHSSFATGIPIWFWARRKSLRLKAFAELRIQVEPGRYRVPDVSVVKTPVPDEQALTSPPYIVIEILSPEDTFGKLRERLDDYLAFGVPNIWVIDSSGRAWTFTHRGLEHAMDATLRSADGMVELPLAGIGSIDA
ncbi:MAG: Uma2 family endonuclease [Acidobacteria bacterium]|nr:Uma2 family endonuclease [Acidobacteriota bacterium]